MIVHNFEANHSLTHDGRLIIPLPRDPSVRSNRESRSQAVRRFLSLETSLTANGHFKELNKVMRECFDLAHAEEAPTSDVVILCSVFSGI